MRSYALAIQMDPAVPTKDTAGHDDNNAVDSMPQFSTMSSALARCTYSATVFLTGS